ncbi:hypothetical protein QNM99_28615 [Pseudomonas sp. PCH446]
MYKLAYEQVQTNMEMLKADAASRSMRSWPGKSPTTTRPNRYFALAHGVGMTGEYPYVVHREDIDALGYDGVFEAGMTICVESYIGHDEAAKGQARRADLYHEHGIELLSDYPFDPRLLPS